MTAAADRFSDCRSVGRPPNIMTLVLLPSFFFSRAILRTLTRGKKIPVRLKVDLCSPPSPLLGKVLRLIKEEHANLRWSLVRAFSPPFPHEQEKMLERGLSCWFAD